MTAFLDRISGLLDKGLLLAALFPILILGFAFAICTAATLGWSASLSWFDSLSTASTAGYTAILSVALLLAAFSLRSLRRPILDLWSGAGGPLLLMRRELDRLAKLDKKIDTLRIWEGAVQIIDAIELTQRRSDIIPSDEFDELNAAIDALPADPTAAEARVRTAFDAVAAQLGTAAKSFDSTALIPGRARLMAFAESRERPEAVERQTLESRRALGFGPREIVTGTRLGNILRALDYYPYKRYRMEGSVFWPHLEQMMKGELLDDIGNQRIMLDFVLAVATLFAVSAVSILIAGPWFWFGWEPVAVALSAAGLSYSAYLISVPAAIALSGALRAGCDLFRHDLLQAFDIAAPSTLKEEREAWQRLSQLVIYGETRDLRFRRAPSSAPIET